MCRSGSPSSRKVASAPHAASCNRHAGDTKGQYEGPQCARVCKACHPTQSRCLGTSPAAHPRVARESRPAYPHQPGLLCLHATSPARAGCGPGIARRCRPSRCPARRAAPHPRAPAATWHTGQAPSSCRGGEGRPLSWMRWSGVGWLAGWQCSSLANLNAQPTQAPTQQPIRRSTREQHPSAHLMQRTMGRGSFSTGSSMATISGRKGASPVAQPWLTAPSARMAALHGACGVDVCK